MKKLVFILLGCFAVLAAQAQQVFNIDRLEASTDGGRQAIAGDIVFPMNPAVYSIVKSAPADFAVVVYVGENGCVATIANKSAIQYRVAEVDSVGFTPADEANIFLCGGGEMVMPTNWLSIQPGQKIESWHVDGLTKKMWRSHTVSRETEVTTTYPVSVPDETIAKLINSTLHVVENAVERAVKHETVNGSESSANKLRAVRIN